MKVAARVHFLAILPALLVSAQAAIAGQTVSYLPGYDGPLPFHLQTGYISVGDSELFYYFVESEGNPLEDPLLLWLTGGPGCSSFSGLIYEIASIIFLDQPVGAGFSYSKTWKGWPSSDSKSAKQSYEFLVKWLEENSQYLKVPLFVTGDSYSGITIPLITKLIADGNKNGGRPYMNLKGMFLGSPATHVIMDKNSRVDFAHRMSLISDEIYENAKRACNERYTSADPTNIACTTAMAEITKCTKDVFIYDILQPKCQILSPQTQSDPLGQTTERRSLQVEEHHHHALSHFLSSRPRSSNHPCPTYMYIFAHAWANEDAVQKALHVRKGTVPCWSRCNESLSYSKDIPNVVPVHEELKKLALQVIVATGDHDMAIPYVGIVKWIKFLNLTTADYWRPWYLDGQVAG
ncbi:serine carboxypeptidase-like 18 [Diospyros lotus]|uniref:serine carboxypeptidase-like 18 n=1 Tax=Diospyros lotus TaxID=55363 RepID=UPI0022555EE4|nr:serine carboxypeptidase-like 18 [Diospyros lotus]